MTSLTGVSIPDSINEHNTQKDHYWPPNTCLVVGDSILNNLDEFKLTKKNKVVKVRAFPGSPIVDMHSYILLLIRKQSTYVGTNGAHDKTADAILDELLQLKSFTTNQLFETITPKQKKL